MTIEAVASWLRVTLDATAVSVVAAGGIATLAGLARSFAKREQVSFTATRLGLARYLALALEFQLAADIVETTIAPSGEDLGMLAAIAAIRTALNYFLAREMREARDTIRSS